MPTPPTSNPSLVRAPSSPVDPSSKSFWMNDELRHILHEILNNALAFGPQALKLAESVLAYPNKQAIEQLNSLLARRFISLTLLQKGVRGGPFPLVRLNNKQSGLLSTVAALSKSLQIWVSTKNSKTRPSHAIVP